MTIAEQQQEIVAALKTLQAEIPELQVYGWRNQTPTPPSIDVYPGNPFQVGAGFGVGEKRVWWTVRARVSGADQETQALLLRMLDAEDPASVEAALDAIDVAVANDDGFVSGFTDDLDGLLSCEWRVSTFT